MKRILQSLAVVAGMVVVVNASATLAIPDGNPVGVVSTINVSGLGTISTISLTLNISGGNNGDLYAYLSYNGNVVTLLNRPGVTGGNPLGFTASGYNVTVADGGSDGDLNTAGSPVNGGTYYADGNSTALGTAYGSGSSTGTWTLFIADLSGGDGSNTSTLNSWYLDINGTTVPEPVTGALIVFGMLGALTQLVAWRARRKSL
jgi:subtilisin-like proprotein convertase family protein